MSTLSPLLLRAERLNQPGFSSEQTKCPADELIKHLFSGFQLLTMTRLARTTGRAGMNLGDKSARVYLGLTLGLTHGQRASLETALAAAREEGNLFIIQPGRKKGRGEHKKKTDKTHYEAAMKDELFKEAPARFRGSVHREKMAVFTYKMFPFWGRLKKPPAIQRDN